MFAVIWESKLKNEPKDGMANGWRAAIQKFDTIIGAQSVYDSMIKRNEFDTFEYRHLMLVQILQGK